MQAALGEALAGRTADVILVIEDGWVVERGTHTELVSAGGRYEELYRIQFDQPAAVVTFR